MSNSRGACWGDLHSLATVQAAGWGNLQMLRKTLGWTWPQRYLWTKLEFYEKVRFSMFTKTPVFLPGKLHGQRSLAGHSPWGPKGSDTTEHPRRHSHTHGRRVSHEYLSYRWGSSDLKNQMYFTIPFSICESVVHFSLLMENGTTKFI